MDFEYNIPGTRVLEYNITRITHPVKMDSVDTHTLQEGFVNDEADLTSCSIVRLFAVHA